MVWIGIVTLTKPPYQYYIKKFKYTQVRIRTLAYFYRISI